MALPTVSSDVTSFSEWRVMLPDNQQWRNFIVGVISAYGGYEVWQQTDAANATPIEAASIMSEVVGSVEKV